MNLPNQLTVLRVILVPFFVFFLLGGNSNLFRILALLIFVGASLTDLLDGKIARARGLVTTFGKLMDPLADKILVMSAMVCFIHLGYAPAEIVIIILAREFLVTSLRLIAAGEGKADCRRPLGKDQNSHPDVLDHCYPALAGIGKCPFSARRSVGDCSRLSPADDRADAGIGIFYSSFGLQLLLSKS